jgi:uncharacterized protein (DUF2267 family)
MSVVDRDHFVAGVEHGAGIPRDEAERAVEATLTTLAERISGGEARDIAEQLAPDLRPLLTDGDKAEPFDYEEFLRRVAEREGVPPDAAERDARAVFAVLGHAVTHDEIADMASELPREFAPLITAATSVPGPPEAPVGTMSFDDFIDSVARRAGLDTEAARRASEAVLEALADRISAGEVDDLVSRLPAQFRPALERGKLRSHGASRRMSLDEFLQRIADLQGTTPDQAKEHARAVFATLRQTVGEKEFRDVTAQLPKEYAVLFVRPSQV